MTITMIGLDTAKSVFQVHGVDSAGKVQLKRKLRRDELLPFFEKQEKCIVVIEACGAGHHWARMLTGLGHDVKLIAPEAAKPSGHQVRTHQNDGAAGGPGFAFREIIACKAGDDVGERHARLGN
jgi:transposase